MACSRDLADMDYHGLSWTIIDYHRLSWTIMDCHGLSWTVMDCYGLSWTYILITFLQTFFLSDRHWYLLSRVRKESSF